MVINKNAIVKILCAVMALVGLSMLLPLFVSLYYREFRVAHCFGVCAVPVILLGLLGIKILPKQDNSILRMRDGFFIVASTWIVMSLIGCIPFVISGAIPRFADAFFETVSGFTTTGSSILSEIQSLPKGILFWRSFTHWLGGMGVLVLTIALLPMLGIGGQKIMRAETTGPTMDKISFTINSGARGLYIVYAAMTLVEIVLLMLCGLDLFDASTHAFGTMGTGGFSTYNASIGAFQNLPAEIVINVVMVLAG
ncbi:MAG: TrkH family potassium uptake protein, partial [Firmicutes bacterium]|nr:TrkH family potassium uptake protein [Bacillota bacterium]